MDKLYKKTNDLNIPFIGINRKYINKTLKELEEKFERFKNQNRHT